MARPTMNRVRAQSLSGAEPPKYLAQLVAGSTDTPVLSVSLADAISFAHPEPARRQALALQRILGDGWIVEAVEA